MAKSIMIILIACLSFSYASLANSNNPVENDDYQLVLTEDLFGNYPEAISLPGTLKTGNGI